jgi:hypothetical protein
MSDERDLEAACYVPTAEEECGQTRLSTLEEPSARWTATPPTEIGHYWWRWKGQKNAQGICELIEHDGEMYFAHTGFLAHENGEPVQREWWPVRLEPPR